MSVEDVLKNIKIFVTLIHGIYSTYSRCDPETALFKTRMLQYLYDCIDCV